MKLIRNLNTERSSFTEYKPSEEPWCSILVYIVRSRVPLGYFPWSGTVLIAITITKLKTKTHQKISKHSCDATKWNRIFSLKILKASAYLLTHEPHVSLNRLCGNAVATQSKRHVIWHKRKSQSLYTSNCISMRGLRGMHMNKIATWNAYAWDGHM